MVAAHPGDLKAAAGCGLRTAYVPRPLEHGPGKPAAAGPQGDFDIVAKELVDLAAQLGS